MFGRNTVLTRAAFDMALYSLVHSHRVLTRSHRRESFRWMERNTMDGWRDTMRMRIGRMTSTRPDHCVGTDKEIGILQPVGLSCSGVTIVAVGVAFLLDNSCYAAAVWS